MHAVILAAGKGTRLRPLTETTPKPLLPMGDTTILDHTLAALPHEITNVIIIVDYLKEKIKEHVAQLDNTLTIKLITQKDMSGTYGALKSAQKHLSDRFLVLNGDDIYTKEELTEMLKHERSIGLQYHHMPNHGGVVVKNDLLSELKKPDEFDTPERLAVTGDYLLDTDFFTLSPVELPNGEYGIPHTLCTHTDTYPVSAVTFTNWLPINTPEELKRAQNAGSFVSSIKRRD